MTQWIIKCKEKSNCIKLEKNSLLGNMKKDILHGKYVRKNMINNIIKH